MDKLFKWFESSEENLSIVQLSWFTSKFGIDDFEGIEKIFVLFLSYCAEFGIPAKRQYLMSFLKTEGKKYIKKYKIRLETMNNFNYDEPASLEEAYKLICSTALIQYDEYMKVDLTDRTFKVDAKTFMEEQKVNRLQKAMADAFPLLTSGGDIDEVATDLQYKIDKIKQTYDSDYLAELDFMSGKQQTSNDGGEMRFLFNTGIPCIDGDTGGMFSKQVWTLSSQPGAGKTRFAAIHFAYQAAVVYHLDVLFDELELTAMEVRNMLISYHILNLYNGNIKIPDKLINTGRLTDEQRRYVEGARIDLFETEGKYGKIIIRDEDLIVEKLKKNMYTYLRHNKDTQLWIVDYAGLVKSVPEERFARRQDEYEIISDFYKSTKDIAKKADIGVLVVNQFNEKGVQAAYAGKKIIPGHVQAGQIIQRHSDYDLAMCMTEEQEIANMRTLSTVKKRSATGFQNAPLSTDLSVSIFRQLRKEATN